MFRGELADKTMAEATGLEHRVYLPKIIEKAPVFLLLHGRTGSSSVMWPFTKALQGLDPVIIAPQAPMPDVIGGFSWWEVRTPEQVAARASTFEELTIPVNQILDFLNLSASIYGFGLEQVHVMGFSQGAGVASSIHILHPKTFVSCSMLAGFLPRLIVEELNSKKPDLSEYKFFVAHGTLDETIKIERARAGVNLLKECGAKVKYIEEDVGHKVGTLAIKGMQEFFLQG